jgi:hypothetical protein
METKPVAQQNTYTNQTHPGPAGYAAQGPPPEANYPAAQHMAPDHGADAQQQQQQQQQQDAPEPTQHYGGGNEGVPPQHVQ